MKYAFMTFSTPDLILDDVLATAKKYGYDGVELRIQSEHAHGIELECLPETRSAARKKSVKIGIAFHCIATSCRYADPVETADNVIKTLQAIDLAADIGAPRIRVFGGMFPDTMSRNQAIDRVAGALSDVADRAEERGVIVCLETHDAWYDPKYVVAVLEKVNHPYVAANWDIMHPVRNYAASMEEAFVALKPWIKHVHFHDGVRDPSLAFSWIGEGVIDHQCAVALLIQSGYEYSLSGEWINWKPYNEVLPRELEMMKRYEHMVK